MIQLAALVVVNAKRAVLVEHHKTSIRHLHRAHVLIADISVVLCDNLRLLEHGTGRSADMERPHRQLGAGLSNGLCGNDAHRRTERNRLAGGHVPAIAFRAASARGFTGQHTADFHHADVGGHNRLCRAGINFLACGHNDLAGARVIDIVHRSPARNPVRQRDQFLVPLINGLHLNAVQGVAVLLNHNNVLSHIHHLARQVTGFGCLQCGVGQTLARAVRADEILQHAEALAEVRQNRTLNDFARRLGHQTAHAGQLTDLLTAPTGAGVHHHVDGVGGFLVLVVFHNAEHHMRDFFRAVRPNVDDLVIALAVRDYTLAVLRIHSGNLLAGVGNYFLLFGGNDHVRQPDGDASQRGEFKTGVFQAVENLHGFIVAGPQIALADEVFQILLGDLLIDEPHALGPDFVEEHPANSRGDDRFSCRAVKRLPLIIGIAEADAAVQFQRALVKGGMHFVNAGENRQMLDFIASRLFLELPDFILLRLHGHVIAAQRNILRGCGDRFPARRRKDVVRRKHQQARFELRLHRQRHMHGHLVAVEVRIVRGADKRMNPDGLALDQHRLKSLNAQTMQGRSAVQHDGMPAGHFLQNIPHHIVGAFDHFLRASNGVHNPLFLKTPYDERLKKHQGHLLGKAALTHVQIRSDHNHGTAGVIHTLAQQILAETSLLALQHVAEGFQRTVAGAGHGPAVAPVVKQRIHRLLKHAFLVADDHIRCFQLQQVPQTVVAVDHTAIEIVQIRCRKPAALQRDQRAQIRGNHRQHFQNHPLRPCAALQQAVNNLHALCQFLSGLLAPGLREFRIQFLQQLRKLDMAHQITDGLRPHLGLKRRLAVFLLSLAEFDLAQQLFFLQRGVARINDDIVLIIKNALKAAAGHVQNKAHAAGSALEKPDVRDRHGQLNMPHPFAANPRLGDFHAAAVAYHAFVLDALEFSAGALPVLCGPENTLAEQTALFRIERPVVDGFRILDFAKAPRPDCFRRSQRNACRVESAFGFPTEYVSGVAAFQRAPPALDEDNRSNFIHRPCSLLCSAQGSAFPSSAR